MLHTDAFNPSNKRKMTKADYIKNTRFPGVPTEVLEVRWNPLRLFMGLTFFQCFYDNIVFAPFIFIEVPEDINSQPGSNPDLGGAISTPTLTLPSANVTANFKTGNKVDPYYLIMNVRIFPTKISASPDFSKPEPLGSLEG